MEIQQKLLEEVTDIPVQVANTCGTSLDNPNWHTNVDNHNTTPIACKIYQTQYPCQSVHLQHINIYEWIWIYMINIYDFKNNAKYAMWYNIDAMFHTIYHTYVLIQISHY